MTFHVTYNFVQGYDAGQKKIVASEMDQNFADIEWYINTSSVNIAETQTITGDKTFTGTVDLSDASVVGGPYINAAEAAHAAMPSGQYVDLTVPASGGTTTAPDDGWFAVKAAVQGTNQGHVLLDNGSIENQCSAVGNNADYSISTMVPVSKNDQVVLSYGFVTINTFRFYYANGSAPTV